MRPLTGRFAILLGCAAVIAVVWAVVLDRLNNDREVTLARAVRVQLLLLDARISGVDKVAWPAKARRIFLVADSDSRPALRASADSCVAPDRLVHELVPALNRLFRDQSK